MNDELATILRDRVADASPDLDRLVRVATSQGTRIRRRRHAGIALGAAAALAVVGVGAATTLGGTPRATVPQFADGPSAGATAPARANPEFPALHDGLRFRLPSGVRVLVARRINAALPATRYRLVILGSPAQLRAFKAHDAARLSRAYPHVVISTPDGISAPQPRYAAGHRIALHLQGWTLDGRVADDKQILTGPDGAVADVVWRPASAYADWVSSTDKGRDPAVWTSPVHDGVFVSVQGGVGTSPAQVQAIGAAITWVR